MTNLSTGDVSPGETRDGDRKNLPMTQVDDAEIARHLQDAENSTADADAPQGEGVGIAGETGRVPGDAGDDATTAEQRERDGEGIGEAGETTGMPDDGSE